MTQATNYGLEECTRRGKRQQGPIFRPIPAEEGLLVLLIVAFILWRFIGERIATWPTRTTTAGLIFTLSTTRRRLLRHAYSLWIDDRLAHIFLHIFHQLLDIR